MAVFIKILENGGLFFPLFAVAIGIEAVLVKMLENGELSLSLLVAIILIWFLKFFWPDYVERSKEKMKVNQELRERELAMEERLRMKEIESQQASQLMVVKELNHVKQSIDSIHITLNDFLQNLLSQYLKERKELTDAGGFRREGV